LPSGETRSSISGWGSAFRPRFGFAVPRLPERIDSLELCRCRSSSPTSCRRGVRQPADPTLASVKGQGLRPGWWWSAVMTVLSSRRWPASCRRVRRRRTAAIRPPGHRCRPRRSAAATSQTFLPDQELCRSGEKAPHVSPLVTRRRSLDSLVHRLEVPEPDDLVLPRSPSSCRRASRPRPTGGGVAPSVARAESVGTVRGWRRAAQSLTDRSCLAVAIWPPSGAKSTDRRASGVSPEVEAVAAGLDVPELDGFASQTLYQRLAAVRRRRMQPDPCLILPISLTVWDHWRRPRSRPSCPRRRGELVPAVRENARPDVPLLPLSTVSSRRSGHVPEAHRPVGAAAGHRLAVGRERQCPYRRAWPSASAPHGGRPLPRADRLS